MLSKLIIAVLAGFAAVLGMFIAIYLWVLE